MPRMFKQRQHEIQNGFDVVWFENQSPKEESKTLCTVLSCHTCHGMTRANQKCNSRFADHGECHMVQSSCIYLWGPVHQNRECSCAISRSAFAKRILAWFFLAATILSLLKKWDHRWRAPRMDKNKTSIVWSYPGGFQFQVSNFRLYKSVSECNSQFPIPLPSFRIPLPVSQYHVPVSEHHCVVSEYHSECHFQFPNPSFRIPPPVSEYHSPVSDYHRDLVGCNERRPEWSIGTKSLLRCFTDAASHCDSFGCECWN